MKVTLFDTKGKVKDKSFDLGFSFDSNEVNESLLNQYMYVYRSNQRIAQAKSKDRSEVRGGGRKPWKQKGTGRARVGSNRSPIWRSGGVTFGPTGEQNYKKKMSKKMKKKAMQSAITFTASNKLMSVVEGFEVNKTADVVNFFASAGLDTRGTLVVHNGGTDFYKKVRNVADLKATDINELNVYDLLTARHIVVAKEALDELKKKY